MLKSPLVLFSILRTTDIVDFLKLWFNQLFTISELFFRQHCRWMKFLIANQLEISKFLI